MPEDALSRQYDIVTLGDLNVDMIVSGNVVPRFGQVEQIVDDYTIEMGGSCCIFACQAARLGLRVGMLGRVGDDQFGEVVLSTLRACGVDTSHVIIDPTLKTGMSLVLTQNNDRAILTYLGSINALTPADVSDAFLASARHLHHGSFFLHTQLRPAMPQIFDRAHALGLTTSLDTNWDPADAWGAPLAETIARTDVCLPNEQEALRIAGSESLDDAMRYWRNRAPLVALKRGAEGAMLYTRDAAYAGPRLAPVTSGDSIGAGDSFDAGFLAGWLRGLPLATCVAIASYCGRAVATAIGGLRGQPSWEDVTHFLEHEF